eukprot:2114958-Ditylum_brightwellii.AAC.1
MAMLKSATTTSLPDKTTSTTWVDTTTDDNEWVDKTGSTLPHIVLITSALSDCKAAKEINPGPKPN